MAGAGWTFIIYGLIHVSLVGAEHYQKSRRSRLGMPPIVYRGTHFFMRVLLVFLIVSFTRVLFRGDSLADSVQYITDLFTSNIITYPISWLAASTLCLAITFHFSPIQWRDNTQNWFTKLPSLISAVFITVLIYILTAFGTGTAGFIYFQF